MYAEANANSHAAGTAGVMAINALQVLVIIIP
jgi:hypothetical protein